MLDYTTGVQQCWSRHNGETETYSPDNWTSSHSAHRKSLYVVTGGVQKPFSGLTVTSVW